MSDNKAESNVPLDESENALERNEDAPVTDTQDNEMRATRGPLSADEFSSILQRIDALGLTWTGDVPPKIKQKSAESTEAYSNDEFQEIRRNYPGFPRELARVILYALTGEQGASSSLGNKDDLEKKITAVRGLISNTEFRSEFFFKYAIKVPYFSEFDWEVVIKAFEKGVKDSPKIAYALLSLSFHPPVNPSVPFNVSERSEPKKFTVAVDEKLVDKLIRDLSEVKYALQKSTAIVERMDDVKLSSEDE